MEAAHKRHLSSYTSRGIPGLCLPLPAVTVVVEFNPIAQEHRRANCIEHHVKIAVSKL